jgi:drug/metabolite transporter (DMT)-like permease
MCGRGWFSCWRWRDIGSAMTDHSLGLLLVAGAALAWSTGGLFFRLIDLDPWTTSFWRSLFAAAFLAAYALFERRHRGVRIYNRAEITQGLVISIGIAISMTTFLPALALTSVANVAFIYATAPILTAILAFVWLNERPDRITIVCALTVVAGSSIMVLTATSASSNLGDILAFISTMSLAFVALALRAWRPAALGPFMVLANVLVASIAFIVAPSLSIDLHSSFLLAGFALVQVTMSFTLFSLGARLLPARETALVNAIEGPLSPFWVWLCFGEQPPPGVIASGIVIFGAVVTYLSVGTRPLAQEPRSGSREASHPTVENDRLAQRPSNQSSHSEGA